MTHQGYFSAQEKSLARRKNGNILEKDGLTYDVL